MRCNSYKACGWPLGCWNYWERGTVFYLHDTGNWWHLLCTLTELFPHVHAIYLLQRRCSHASVVVPGISVGSLFTTIRFVPSFASPSPLSLLLPAFSPYMFLLWPFRFVQGLLLLQILCPRTYKCSVAFCYPINCSITQPSHFPLPFDSLITSFFSLLAIIVPYTMPPRPRRHIPGGCIPLQPCRARTQCAQSKALFYHRPSGSLWTRNAWTTLPRMGETRSNRPTLRLQASTEPCKAQGDWLCRRSRQSYSANNSCAMDNFKFPRSTCPNASEWTLSRKLCTWMQWRTSWILRFNRSTRASERCSMRMSWGISLIGIEYSTMRRMMCNILVRATFLNCVWCWRSARCLNGGTWKLVQSPGGSTSLRNTWISMLLRNGALLMALPTSPTLCRSSLTSWDPSLVLWSPDCGSCNSTVKFLVFEKKSYAILRSAQPYTRNSPYSPQTRTFSTTRSLQTSRCNDLMCPERAAHKLSDPNHHGFIQRPLQWGQRCRAVCRAWPWYGFICAGCASIPADLWAGTEWW